MDRFGPDPAARNRHRCRTERVSIELPDAGDVDELYRLLSGEERRAVCATLAWDGPEDRSEVQAWVERCRTMSFEDWGFHWVVRDRSGDLTGSTGQALGAIGTRPLGPPGRADVGYWLGRRYWRRGIMSEALAGLIALGADELASAKLEATVVTGNTAGRRLVESAGFELEGVIRRASRKYGEWIDEAKYGMLLGPETAQ